MCVCGVCVCVCVCMYVGLHNACMSTRAGVFVYVCMYIYIYIHNIIYNLMCLSCVEYVKDLRNAVIP